MTVPLDAEQHYANNDEVVMSVVLLRNIFNFINQHQPYHRRFIVDGLVAMVETVEF